MKKLNKNRKMGIRLQNYYSGAVVAWWKDNSTLPSYLEWGVKNGFVRKEPWTGGWSRYVFIPNEVFKKITR